MMMDRIHLFFYKKMMTKIKQLEEQIQMLEGQIQMMWNGFEEGISVDEMNERIFPELFKEE
tara:strand:- start:381 stop:563 length:183 start_codon:yes stop_codon:yes gene_type:complete